ncbi:4'-phosphopantetheinyl transferase family protein [Demequina rhizosphaerae]|uniref:4'-phosphopantetheinyl transferase family protein n=1 Tax=Demequina rhizosphaerae TaxID=1638985 RepID=UPI000784420F|nr:4'-phosphopantetheinyl transferase superfamily protein [Demequina rhizosphaerae]
MTVTIHVAWRRLGPEDDARAASDALARRAVATALGADAESVELGRRCPRCGSRGHGAPVVLSPASPARVSLSRADGVTVAAAVVGPEGLGVDVERAGTMLAREVADVALAPGEVPAQGPDGLLVSWVRKEAVLKAAGTGLATDPRALRLEGTRVVEGPDGPWWLADVDLDGDLVVAVAARGVKVAKIDVEVEVEVEVSVRDAPAAGLGAQARPATRTPGS